MHSLKGNLQGQLYGLNDLGRAKDWAQAKSGAVGYGKWAALPAVRAGSLQRAHGHHGGLPLQLE
jgi:hypothetical protein